MKERFLIIVILALWVSSSAAQTNEPRSTGTLRGMVINDITNEPITGARISIGNGNVNAQILLSNAQSVLNKNTANSEAEARLLEMTANSIAGTNKGRDFTTITDKDGRFSFEAIPAGEYPLAAERDRYVGADSIYDRLKAPWVSQARATVESGKATEIVFKLIPAAIVSGRIMDSNGNALANATVGVLLRTIKDGIPSTKATGEAMSNDRGEFRIFQLRPGEYVFSAAPSSSRSQNSSKGVLTFYPGVASLSEATPVKLRPGEELGGILIQIRNSPGAGSSPASPSQN
jgi:hypothetical protein